MAGNVVVSGPDVAVVGWIPRIEPTFSLLPAGYRQCLWPWSLAMLALFASGNPDPLINSSTDYQNLMASKEFRVAVTLRNVHAEWNGSQAEGRVFFDPPDIRIGYTPLNIWRPTPQGWNFALTVRHSRGLGSSNVLTEMLNQDYCVIRLFVRFKLAWWLNIIQSIFTQHLAPSAIIDIQYVICRDGFSSIQFAGSILPSQKCYIDWNTVYTHDMKFNTTQDIKDYITAGDCTDSPVYTLGSFIY